MTLSQPGWLALLLLVPLLLVGALLAARARAHRWSSFVAPRLRPTLLRKASPIPRWISLLSLLAAFTALTAALSRPQGEGGARTETVRGHNVLLAIDLSRSMLTTDVKPSRLDQAKALAFELLEKLPDDRVGVLAFAGTAFSVAPLTVDHAAVRETVAQLDSDTIPTGGSDLAGAVRAAIGVFDTKARGHNALVILSDGEEHDGEIDAAALEADRAGLFIVSIGIGTADGDFIPDPREPDQRYRDREGDPVLSRLHEEPLRALATETGGQFVRAHAGTDVAALVANATQSLDRFEIATRKRTVMIEFYQWLVLPAILLLIASILAATHWRVPAAAATTAAGLALCAAPARAAELPPEVLRHAAAAEAARGDKAARYRLAEGTGAIRANDLRHARGALSRALLAADPAVQAAAHHNLGNALLESGWRQLSQGESYPGDPGALAKLEQLATAKLEAWLAAQAEGTTPSAGFREFESVLLAWSDAARHFGSAAAADPAREDSRHNRTLALRLLQELRKILEREADSLEQQIPEPQPQNQGGQPEPQPGEQPRQPEGEQTPQPSPNEGPQPQQGEPREGEGQQPPEQQGEQPKDETGDQQPRSGDAEQPREPRREDESPAERARRILGENADMEQGPLIRNRRREFLRPEKDW
jgi:Ca-activated chloride channel family protein